MKMDEVGKRLDDLGITLVNFRDPVDGSEVPAIDWREAAKLLEIIDRPRPLPVIPPKYRRNGW